VCAPPQVIDPDAPSGSAWHFLADGKAYFASSGGLTAIDLGSGARTEVDTFIGNIVTRHTPTHRLFTVGGGNPTTGTNVIVYDTSVDAVVQTSATIPSGSATRRTGLSFASGGSFDPVRERLFLVVPIHPTGPGGFVIEQRLIRYDVATDTFTFLKNYAPSQPPHVHVDPVSGVVYSLEDRFTPAFALHLRDPSTGADLQAAIPLGSAGFDITRIAEIDSGLARLLVDTSTGSGFATIDLSTGAITAPSSTWDGSTELTDALDRGFINTGTQLREVQIPSGSLVSVLGVPAPTPNATVAPGFSRFGWDEQHSRLVALANLDRTISDTGPAVLLGFPDLGSCSFEITQPTAVHVAPSNGSTFSVGATVSLDLDCGDASGIIYCGAFVIVSDPGNPGIGVYVRDGGALPTGYAGPHRIRDIVAIDAFGNRTERSHLSDPSFDVTYEVVDGPTDSAAPTITLTTPPNGAQYSLGQAVNAAYSCQDEPGGSGLASCVGTVPSGGAIDTASAGAKSFVVDAADNAGHATSVSHGYEVLAGNASGTFGGGQTITTDPGGVGATPAVPVQTALTLPGSLGSTPIAIGTQPTTGSSGGFAFFGTEAVITAGGAVASAAAPFVATFTVDKSLLDGPPAVAATDVQIFRDGVLVSGCTDATAAIPDPCVASKSIGPGGDGIYVVRTTHFSRFSFARFAWNVSGFFAPVDNLPTVNTVQPGRTIPAKFSLGGNRGLDVFAGGYPKTQAYSCETNQPLDAIEEIAPDSGPTLTYDPGSGRYSYAWKTTKTWTGCRELTLRFRDGSELKAHFKFK
jgi:hypothetical protein